MDAFTALLTRRSYRGLFKPDPVPRDDLRKILEAGLAAPSGCNAQSASLIAVDDETLLRKFGALLKKPKFASAPAAVCVLTQKIPVYQGRAYNLQDYAAAIENILLAVTALGYASCWVEGYITGPDKIGRRMADLLAVPADYDLVAFLPIGRPAEPLTKPAFKAFDERAWFNGFRACE